MKTIVLSIAASFLIANVAVAGDCGPASKGCDPSACGKDHGSCNRCGHEKVCKVVCEMKKIKRHVWVVECEDFCPSLPGCGHAHKPSCKSGDGCGSCSGTDPCESLKSRPLVRPRCCKPRTRMKLIKKEVTCKVPTYKCVPVCRKGCCDPGSCKEDFGGEDVQVPEDAPAAPEPAAMSAPPVPDATTGIMRSRVIGTSYLQALRLGP